MSARHWKRVEEGYWEHESGEYYMSLYNCGEWYGELQDKEGNPLGLVAYTRTKADALKRCTKARHALDTVERIRSFIVRHSTFPNSSWHEIDDLVMKNDSARANTESDV